MTWAARISSLLVVAAAVSVSAGCAGRSPPAFDASSSRPRSGEAADVPSDRDRTEQVVSLRGRPVAASSARPRFSDAAPAPEGSLAESSERSSNVPARTWGWVLLSFGAEGAVLAAITSFMMLHDKSVRDENCDSNKICSRDGLAANADIANLASWNAGAWAVAGVGLAVGGLLLLTNPPVRGPGVAIGVSPNGSGLGLDARGAF